MISSENLLEYGSEISIQTQSSYGGTKENSTRKLPQSTAPVDKWNLVRITMYLFGISCLLPWNFFMQANDYWLYKLRNVSAEGSDTTKSETNLQFIFPSVLAIASMVPYVIFLLVNSALAKRIRPEKRMQYPHAMMILLFIVVVAMVPVNTDNHQTTFFAITMCIVVAINVMCGFMQGAGTGIAGSFPKEYMESYVNGMALGGILASCAQILSLVGDSSPVTSAIIYFAIAILMLCITFIMFLVLTRKEYYQFYISKQASSNADKSIVQRNISHFKIFRKMWVYAVSVTSVFWVTLSLLPAIVSKVASTSEVKSIWTGRLFLPVACFFLFNACDLGGRIIATQVPIPSKWKYLTLALTVSRVVFIPLLMLCNATPRKHLPVIFDSDISFIIIMVFFALTNGYLCTVILSQAPKAVEEEHQELAGTQMAFFLGFGLMLGSVTSYGLLSLL